MDNHNAAQSYLKAFGCDYLTARVNSCRLLTKAHIKAEIANLKSLIRAELDIDVFDMLQYCMRVVGANMGDYVKFGQKYVPVMNAKGPIKDPKTDKILTQKIGYVEIGESEMLDTSVISEIKQGSSGISIKLEDKKWAWEQLAKYFDWLPDKWRRELERDKFAFEVKKLNREDENEQIAKILQDVLGGTKHNLDGESHD